LQPSVCIDRPPISSHRVFVCARGSSALVLFVEINRKESYVFVQFVPANVKGKEQSRPGLCCACVDRSFFFPKTYSGDCACRVVWCGQGDTAASSLDVTRGAMTPAPETWTNALLPDFLLAGKPLRSHTLRSFSRRKEQAPTPV
jgi:hypothetical protein